ncbi:MAG: hypothetical protein ACI9JN_000790 [Bacteroidia bacterium]|jgi:hypothetical protein
MKNSIKISVLILIVSVLQIGCDDTQSIGPNNGGNTSFTTAKAFLNSKSPKEQVFTKDVNNRFTIISDNGLHYRFKPNAFKTSAGQIVTGQINLQLTEYLTKSDMVFSGVTTTSGTDVLESGAMFNLTATQNGQALQLVDDYRVQVPSQDQDPNMIIFEGEEVEDSAGSAINWVPSKSSNVVRDSLRSDTSWSDTTYDPGYYYTLKIRFMSWCNLDRYWNSSTGSPIRVKIKESGKESAIVYVAIKTLNGVVTLRYNPNADEFNSSRYNLPNGWDITIIVVYVDRDKEQLEYAWIDSRTRDNHLEEVDTLKVISEADLEALVKSLQ